MKLRALPFALTLLVPSVASAATVSFGVVTPNLKVRPQDMPTTKPSATIKAAKNEFEAFQIVLTAPQGDANGVSVKVSKPIAGGGYTIPADDVMLYREGYYNVGTASNLEGAPGLWPDPLVPDKDEFFGETRGAFPISILSGEDRKSVV